MDEATIPTETGFARVVGNTKRGFVKGVLFELLKRQKATREFLLQNGLAVKNGPVGGHGRPCRGQRRHGSTEGASGEYHRAVVMQCCLASKRGLPMKDLSRSGKAKEQSRPTEKGVKLAGTWLVDV